MIIYNCHAHVFTMKHVPYWYYFGLAHLLRPDLIRGPVVWTLRNILPLSSTDQLNRLAKFAESGFKKSQASIFEELHPHYPSHSRFVILPMDMAGMGYGKSTEGINSQLEELAVLSHKTDGRVMPFVHIDPRRPNALQCIQYWIEVRNFKGVKIYPSLGYRPDDACLEPIFSYCEAQDVPVMTHCSGATVRARNYLFDSARAAKLNSPSNYMTVLERHPALRLCLGHFGGEKAWAAYMRDPAGTGEFANETTKDWLSVIREMLVKYRNLYADISYTMFHFDAYIAALNILLEEKAILDKTLFGSDFYMSHMEVLTERQHCFRVRDGVGSSVFAQLAETNSKAFLGSRADEPALPASGLPAAPVPEVPANWAYA
jgi:predicted TIM-barrel fold metal-dependent hydrolase